MCIRDRDTAVTLITRALSCTAKNYYYYLIVGYKNHLLAREKNIYVISVNSVSYTHLDVYKRQIKYY